MRAGLLRHKISILEPKSTARSTDGAPVITYSTILKDIWAGVTPISGKEIFRDDHRWSVSDKLFTIRYTTAAITQNMVVVFSSDNYEIQEVIPIDHRKVQIDIVGRKAT